jgi:hypothetical protein
VAHLSPAQRVAAGLHASAPPPASAASPLAATQAAWRFYANSRVTLDRLAEPLLACARDACRATAAEGGDGKYVLVAYDWCSLHYSGHVAKADRVELIHRHDLGYELLTALAIDPRDGSPIAPLCLELRAADGTHSTRAARPLPGDTSPLDALGPVMAHVRDRTAAAGGGREPVSIIDREADSVGHYRRWSADGHRVIVRADDARLVLHGDGGAERKLGNVADRLHATLSEVPGGGGVEYKGQRARLFVGQTTVVLHRPARPQRADRRCRKQRGRRRPRKRHALPGAALPMRLVVSEARNDRGKVLARWLLLLTNLPASVRPATVARWYYWRWRIESYHKLLKGAGQQVEHWQQETAAALARRLCVAAMACVVVWQVARDRRPQAAAFRALLVQASGRQMKRGKDARGFTEPALLAGLGVLVPMLALLDRHTPAALRRMVEQAVPFLAARRGRGPPPRESG